MAQTPVDPIPDPRIQPPAVPPTALPAIVPPAPQQTPAPAQQDEQADPRQWKWVTGSATTLAQGLVFGVIFGFLLQKGGVAKFDILIGVLLLEDFTVVKVMLSAIIVGMVGVYLLQRAGVVEPQIKETVYGANIIGGLIFGVGFGLIAYCPGTNAAAVGQGNLDALVGILGMMAGSYAFALSSKYGGGTVSRWGQRGKLTLADMVGVPRGALIIAAVPLLIAVLVALETYVSD